MNDCQMGPSCHGLQEQTPKLEKFLAAGMTRDEVRRAFVADYGSQAILMEPLDEGFNRLAWLLPYVFGIVGLGLVLAVARRWSGGPRADGASVDAPPGEGEPAADAALAEKLDDELRDLD
jgi:cytochrome c-type biogenesis protein CcmH/NrfF